MTDKIVLKTWKKERNEERQKFLNEFS